MILKEVFDLVIIGITKNREYVLSVYNESLDEFQAIGNMPTQDLPWNKPKLNLIKYPYENKYQWPIKLNSNVRHCVYPRLVIQVEAHAIWKFEDSACGYRITKGKFLSIEFQKNCYQATTVKQIESLY